jgi:hypothetical protein
MGQVSGQADGRNSFGVVGTATTDLPQNSVGITGVVGTSESVQSWSDRVDSLGQLVSAAVSGIVSDLHADVIGFTSFGFLAGNDPVVNEHAGVYGQSDQQGVMGISIGTDPLATGVYGGNKTGRGVGVRGETITGVGVQGRTFGAGLAGLSTAAFGLRAIWRLPASSPWTETSLSRTATWRNGLKLSLSASPEA